MWAASVTKEHKKSRTFVAQRKSRTAGQEIKTGTTVLPATVVRGRATMT